MADLARETNTITKDLDVGSYLFDESGRLISGEEGEEYQELIMRTLMEGFEYSAKASVRIDASENLYDYFEREVAKIPDSTADKRKTLLQTAEFWGAFVGSSAHTQSLKFFWLEQWSEGGG